LRSNLSAPSVFVFPSRGLPAPPSGHTRHVTRPKGTESYMSILWIILIVILVLLLLGFFSRGRW
jgi:hypothetical protein